MGVEVEEAEAPVGILWGVVDDAVLHSGDEFRELLDQLGGREDIKPDQEHRLMGSNGV